MSPGPRTELVLFDLDGTLAHTAPDLIGAVQVLRAELGLEPIAEDRVAPAVRDGGAAIVRAGLPERPELHATVLPRYLDLYAEHIAIRTTLYPGMDEVLGRIERAGMRFGVVTNKVARLTEPLLRTLGLLPRAAVVVSGDTLPQRKPDPEPVLHACAVARVRPANAWFVGDDRRDVDAGRAAGTRTVVSRYGYLPPGDDASGWGADYLIDHAIELVALLELG
jgi:phosphoglycolate phosphatase